MIKIGNVNKVKILRKSDIAYIAENEDKEQIFMHLNEVDREFEPEEMVDVFVFYDKQKRICATNKIPFVTTTVANFATVVSLNEFGVFVNIGINKDFLLSLDYLPYDKKLWPIVDDKICVILKLKKERLVAKPLNKIELMEINDKNIQYKENQLVEAYVHRIGEQGTNLVSVDKKDIFVYYKNQRGQERIGKKVEVKILTKAEQGNYLGSLIKQKEFMIEDDKDIIYKKLCEKFNGKMPFTSSSSSDEIYKEFKMSRKAFKRALGNLYKSELIYFDEEDKFTLKKS